MRPVSYLPTPSPPVPSADPTWISPVHTVHAPERIVRRAVPADLRHTAALHRRELPHGLFAQLGGRFLARWHRAYLDSPHGVALVTIEYPVHGRPRLVGFLTGTTDRAAFRRDLDAQRLGLVARAVGGLLARPPALAHLARGLRPYLRGLAQPRSGRPPTRVAELTAVAVAPDTRRHGVGQDLVEAFLRTCATAGTDWAESSVPATVPDADAFCTRTGWIALGEETGRDGAARRRFGRLI